MTSLTKPADDTIKAVFKGGRGQGINHSNECYNLLMDYDSLEQVINDQAVKTAGAEMCIFDIVKIDKVQLMLMLLFTPQKLADTSNRKETNEDTVFVINCNESHIN